MLLRSIAGVFLEGFLFGIFAVNPATRDQKKIQPT